MVHVADWFATFAALAGIDDPSDPDAVQQGLPDIDSINMWPYLTGELGKDGLSSGRSELLLAAPAPLNICKHAALIQGDWKIVSSKVAEHEEGVSEEEDERSKQFSSQREMKLRAGSDPCASAEGFALYNLAEDPYEEHPYWYDAGDTPPPSPPPPSPPPPSPPPPSPPPSPPPPSPPPPSP